MKKFAIALGVAALLSGCARSSPEHAIPNVVGKSYGDAMRAMDAVRFCLTSVHVEHSDASLGTILQQSPKAGYQAVPGYQVGVVISDGSGSGTLRVPPSGHSACPATTLYKGDPFGPVFTPKP